MDAMRLLKLVLNWLLRKIYRVEVKGIENIYGAGKRVLIVANHTSFLDGLLLGAFLPDRLTFAVNTYIAKVPWFQPALALVNFFPLDPTNPLSLKSLIRYLQTDRKVVIFPEGRITVTGSLMKVYQGPGLVADRSDAMIVPVRIEGAQYTPFSRLRGRVRLRWFPKITLTIHPPRKIQVSKSLSERERRTEAGEQLSKIMSEIMFASCDCQRTIFEAVLDARTIHGGSHVVADDIKRQPLTYDKIISRSIIMGGIVSRYTRSGEFVGMLLPNMSGTLVSFLALQLHGRVPVMLNYSVGLEGLLSAVHTAQLRIVVTSKRFIEQAKLESNIEKLQEHINVLFAEDLQQDISKFDVFKGLTLAFFARSYYHSILHKRDPNSPAVILFTSGSEGTPKGVVLSHVNLLSNKEQLASQVDFNAQDVILNALPLFHTFGLSAGTLLPLLSGMKVVLYPSPLHYRIIPEIAYEMNATVLFATNTFLAGYGEHGHPYDFYSMRYVFAGAEKLHEGTRQLWSEKFGIRVLEGYGATEASPGLATNTSMNYRRGSVGRLLPGIDYQLEPVPGIEEGGRLYVRGPNIMLGYLLDQQPGVIRPPQCHLGTGWYDTGDIVSIDEDGFVWIRGRVKRFAKIGGEMVSLTAVEHLANEVWPAASHAAISIPDPQKGEQLVLVTDCEQANRSAMLALARERGIGEIAVPKRIVAGVSIPVLGTGKVDYQAVLESVVGESA